MLSLLKSGSERVKSYIKLYVNYRNDELCREWYYRHSKKLLKFKNIHKGEDCFIIGNGPSLNKMDLSELKNYHTFGLNKIYLIFDKVDLNLSYHISVNPLVIEQSAQAFEKLNCPSFLSFRPARNIVKEKEHINFILTGGPFTFQEEITHALFEGYTVTYVAMQIAYYMGFSNVFLIGVDHNFKAKGDPNETQLLKGRDQNHFHPDYFKGKEWQLPDLEGSELSYSMARFFYNRAGRRIIDATVGGKLKIFPKASFENALKVCKKKK